MIPKVLEKSSSHGKIGLMSLNTSNQELTMMYVPVQPFNHQREETNTDEIANPPYPIHTIIKSNINVPTPPTSLTSTPPNIS
jgi:hypothetical protein